MISLIQSKLNLSNFTSNTYPLFFNVDVNGSLGDQKLQNPKENASLKDV